MFGLGDRVLAIIAAALAALFLLFGVVQTVRIDGFDLGFFYAVKGYKPLYADALVELAKRQSDITTLRGNQLSLQAGLNVCNAAADQQHKLGVQLTAQTQQLIDQLNAMRGKYAGAIAAVGKIKSSDEVCPVADQIIREGFQ